MEFEPVIGLEVHVQLKTNTKIFCSCPAKFGSSPNESTCPVCLGMPGVLPVLNKKAVEFAIMASLATNCQVQKKSVFARKNYFYPDLPKGYQISQFELPLALSGYLEIESDITGDKKRIGITRIHMEEDAGKLIHDSSMPVSYVDLNRAGTPLIEIVSEPDLRSAREAGNYLRQLHAIVKYLQITDGNMEEGSFRCDANVSVRPKGSDKLGTRTEIKNLNSFRHVENGIEHEIARQIALIEDGQSVVQETRLWNPDKFKTFSMRGKEEAHDYRYFPDPDLVPVEINDEWENELKQKLPELPEQKKNRFINELKISEQQAETLTSSRELSEFFETCANIVQDSKLTANWLLGTFLSYLRENGIEADKSEISPEFVAEILTAIKEGKVNDKTAKEIFSDSLNTKKSPSQIIKDKGLEQVSDEGELEAVVDKILASNPDEVEKYKAGNKKLISFFMGQVMKETKGKANPKLVNPMIAKKLG
ncbi:MAG: Asp-tRNA(Asn)/Glu-tRNA(Gln) amidotransferase subunit GatB [Desulfobacteraceae bacterium]|nr:Asp-tRNA(Asn)/Glu-tRNA(Gln) amidotransferase subunit GatB [Desulfobacteraceae bacterium]MCB9494322.1 Asp-tRNA(Asn)/Glu-tRNA(Gln) amidotransferase subunit GatB [Desulfobacteraceae bacterium]